jgi:hypothetical protein
MKQFLLAFLLLNIQLHAQKIISFTPVPVQVNSPYQYKNIFVVDSRKDTTMLGRVVKGTFGVSEALAPVMVKGSLQEAYNNFFTASTLHLPQGHHDILINITDLFIDEEPTLGSSGTVDFRAEVYAVKEGLYYPIHTYDRYETVTAFDATKKLINEMQISLKNAVELSHGFFNPEVFNQKGLSREEILLVAKQDRLKKYPVYGAESFKEGIYSTFQEFLNNAPSRPINTLESFIASNTARPKRKRETIYGYCKDGVFTHFYNGVNYSEPLLFIKGMANYTCKTGALMMQSKTHRTCYHFSLRQACW